MATGDGLKSTKAIAAAALGFVAPGASIIIFSVTDGSAGGSTITTGEWITAICTCIVTAGSSGLAVRQIENRPKA